MDLGIVKMALICGIETVLELDTLSQTESIFHFDTEVQYCAVYLAMPEQKLNGY